MAKNENEMKKRYIAFKMNNTMHILEILYRCRENAREEHYTWDPSYLQVTEDGMSFNSEKKTDT